MRNERIHESDLRNHPARNDKMSEIRLPDSTLCGSGFFFSCPSRASHRPAGAEIVSSDPTGVAEAVMSN